MYEQQLLWIILHDKREPFRCWVLIYIKSNFPIKWKSMGSPVHNYAGLSVAAVPATVSGIMVVGVTLVTLSMNYIHGTFR